MPYCKAVRQVTNDREGIRIFYRTYGKGSSKVLLIIGLAGTHDSWGPQIKALTGSDSPNTDDKIDVDEGPGFHVCAFDNRGMGRSSIPTKKSEYTTEIMAMDALSLMDHLQWKKAHVIGHSMGAMVACKVAAVAPERILSLGLLNVTGGGFECLPRLDRRTVSIAYRFLKAKTPEERAAVDLDTHYTREFLDEPVGLKTRRAVLYQEYVKAISSSGMQSPHGFDGQINACWTHSMTRRDIETIRASGFLVSVIHGRDDVIAQIEHGRRVAWRLQPAARMVELHGGHLVSHERPEEVNKAVMDLVRAAEEGVKAAEWTNLAVGGRYYGGGAGLLRIIFVFVCAVFALLCEYFRRAQGRLKPPRVGASLT